MKKIYIKPNALPLATKITNQLMAASPVETSDGVKWDMSQETGEAEDGEDAGAKRRSLWDSDDE